MFGGGARAPLVCPYLKPLTSLRAYRHVMLDMNGTFLFDFDNFGPEQDFGASYASLGYASVSPAEAHRRVRAAYDYMAPRYEDPAFYADFPTVAEALRATAGRVLAKAELGELVDTFARHELGRLPDEHAAAIQRLSAMRPLSVLSNLWAPPARWEASLTRCGLRQNFVQMVYSCEGRHIKPHPAIFEWALNGLGLAPSEVLYVGDSYRCDVGGARAAGLDVVWLHGERPVPPTLPPGVYAAPDLVSWISALKIPA